MRKLFAMFAALAANLAGCGDRPHLQAQLKAGVSTARDVREAMGPPSMEWKLPDGSRWLSLPRMMVWAWWAYWSRTALASSSDTLTPSSWRFIARKPS